MKTIATIKEMDEQLIIELRDEGGTLIDMYPVDELSLTQGAYRKSRIIREDSDEQS